MHTSEWRDSLAARKMASESHLGDGAPRGRIARKPTVGGHALAGSPDRFGPGQQKRFYDSLTGNLGVFGISAPGRKGSR